MAYILLKRLVPRKCFFSFACCVGPILWLCSALGRRQAVGRASDQPAVPDSLQQLVKLLPFPEEVALQLTDTEHALFSQVAPVDYVRHVTTELTRAGHPGTTGSADRPQKTVHDLVRQFHQVSGGACFNFNFKFNFYIAKCRRISVKSR